jgi:hypothetical protein
MSSRSRKQAIVERASAVPETPSVVSQGDPLMCLDLDGIYRAVALACACLVTGQNKDHTRAISVADDFLEFIDPRADNPRAHQSPEKRKR